MKTQKNDAKTTKYRLAEASFLFVLILAVAIGVGVKMSSSEAEETVAVQSTTPTAVSNAELASQVIATAEAAQAVEEIAEITELAQTVATDPGYDDSTPASLIYQDGENAFFERDFSEAVRIFDIYTERRPANAWGHYMHGLSLLKSNELDDSETAFGRALELKPEHLKSLVNLGRVHLAQNRAEDALTQVETALIIDPSYADGYRVLGRVYHNLGRSEEAAAAYLSALSRRDDDAWALNNLGLIYLEMECPDDALAPLARAVSLDAGQAVFQNNLGMALERTGHMVQAADAYTKAVELNGYAKAVTSLTRVDGWLDATGDRDHLQVDLVALADAFVDQLQVAVESTDDMSTTEQAPVLVVSAADSTAVSPPAPTTVAVSDIDF